MNLTSLKEAIDYILSNTEDFNNEEINFNTSLNRVLAEEIIADRDFPPFNRVSMDGIAIDFDEFEKGVTDFKIEGVQAAGSSQLTLKNTKSCIETMTGSTLPNGTSAVIPYELISIENGIAHLNTSTINYYQNIHKQGTDRKQNDLILAKNTLISTADIGVLATVGKVIVKVKKQPKVMIISTGDELVEVNKLPKSYQIRRSNVHTLVALLDKLNIKTDNIHISDDKEQLKITVKQLLTNYDVLLFSGAVSKGKFDFIPEILNDLGVKKLFHKVSQRPGKPFWFGKKERTTIFAFPGNPVSTYVSCLRYFYPWYKKSIGLPFENSNFAVLDQDYTFKPNLTYFLQVKLSNKKGCIYATPIVGHGSGDLANLADVDAFLELPTGKNEFKKGEVFNYLRFR